MPKPFDLLTEKLDDPDPGDDLSMMLGQDQGANLAGGPEQNPDAQPNLTSGPAPPVQPATPSVPGPLAALAAKGPPKPHIKLKALPPKPKPKPKPRIKLKTPPMRIKPHIKLRASANV